MNSMPPPPRPRAWRHSQSRCRPLQDTSPSLSSSCAIIVKLNGPPSLQLLENKKTEAPDDEEEYFPDRRWYVDGDAWSASAVKLVREDAGRKPAWKQLLRHLEHGRRWRILTVQHSRRLLLLLPDDMANTGIERQIGGFDRVQLLGDFLPCFRPELSGMVAGH
ncbi:MAG: hypothetical protein M1826_007410 [Phylliscum demangeonii]|nr:MAG: hypothetical protein M1826_007410 [Phylliscum demangeonii]